VQFAVFLLAETTLLVEYEESLLVFLSTWFGKRKTRESLITLAIRSLLSFVDSRFCSTWFCTFKNSFLSFRMAPDVYLVGFFFGCSFQFCLALIYLVWWMLILLWFHIDIFLYLLWELSSSFLLLGMAFPDWESLFVWLLSILWESGCVTFLLL